MSFGSDLQGWQSHEALLNVQDYEIGLLENVRKCIAQRAKCDREYISTLTSLVSNATHKLDNETHCKTPMGQVWSVVVGETEALIQLMHGYADQLGTSILDAVTQVVAEKKLIRKLYAEKRNHMEMELDRLLDEVNKYKEQYERQLTKLVQNRMRYEIMYKKNPVGRSNSKLDEARAKYLRSEGKVRNTHNSYLTALCEVNVYQQQYSCVALPALLDAQQGLQENLIKLCKQILEQYSSLTDWSKQQFHEIHENIRAAIETVNPTSEYSEFVASYRTEPVKFAKQEFQKSVVQNYLPNSHLSAGEIVVDESTVEAIKQSKTLYLEQLAKCRQRLSSKQQELQDAEKQFNSSLKSDMSAHAEKRTVSVLRREMMELQCTEEKYSALVQLVGEPLGRLGPTHPPPGVSDFVDFGAQLDSENLQQLPPQSAANPNLQNTLSHLRSSITKKKKVPTATLR